MRHTFSETWSGLRRNASMTLAVVVTMWVSLSLFGAGLLAARQVDLLKDRWYDKIEISAFLCVKDVKGDNCDPGQDATDAQKAAVLQAIQQNPETQDVFYESKQQAFDEFKRVFQGSSIEDSLTVDQMQDSYRVKLKNPANYQGLVSEISSMKGVQFVQDLHVYLDPIFTWLNALRWGTIGMSVLLLLAASLQIGNTIRMAAFARRRELGIMRLVGASNIYIMLPFLLESLFAAILGAALASATLAAGLYFVIVQNAQVSLKGLRWIGWSDAGLAMAGVAGVAVVLSIAPTLIATRRYLRV
ncbi:MAG TPA: permease-like cell division protein FtsX [Propionibacteriaceae bacterium]|nr:permease-like cell division protein FtsX [Propionibacteriaceae bacterium]